MCVQVWLGQLSDEMKDTLKELLLECLKDAKQSKGGLDPNKYPSQVFAFGQFCILLKFISVIYVEDLNGM